MPSPTGIWTIVEGLPPLSRQGRAQEGQALLESSYEKLYGNGRDPGRVR